MSLGDDLMSANWLRKGGRLLLERLISRYGYELKEAARSPSGPRRFLSMLTDSGYRPATVFDIGVGFGTPWLYEAFPEAYFVLVEANGDLEPNLSEICGRYRGEYHLVAAGPEPKRATMNINTNRVTSSSLLPLESEYLKKLGTRSIKRTEEDRVVEIRPLDSLLSDRLEAPFLVKLDVEGYESEVLRGAAGVLEKTDLIVTEISVTKRFEGEKRFRRLCGAARRARFSALRHSQPGTDASRCTPLLHGCGLPETV